MRTLKKFTGINNVMPPEQLGDSDLVVASNVDIDLAGVVHRRAGHAAASVLEHKNLWDAGAFKLATRGAAGDLVNVTADTVLAAGVGHARMRYCDLPGDRVLCGNGAVQLVVSAAAATPWGVPLPAGLGAVADIAGNLQPGDYQYALTHQRLADGAEGGPAYSAGATAIALGGVSFTGLPVPAGHRTNVYLTSHYGGERYYIGGTTTGALVFTGGNAALQRKCPTDFLQPPPLGSILGFWRGRALVAVGSALFASRPHSWELFDLRRDFKAFSAPITLVQPTTAGIWVGTEQELCFLAGDKWDNLARVVKATGGVTPGSGCKVPGEQIMVGKGRGQGDCMVCIADGWIVAGLADGTLVPLSLDRYRVAAAEVAATFRVVDGIPQYIAAEQ